MGTGQSRRVGDGLERLIELSGRAVRVSVDPALQSRRGPLDFACQHRPHPDPYRLAPVDLVGAKPRRSLARCRRPQARKSPNPGGRGLKKKRDGNWTAALVVVGERFFAQENVAFWRSLALFAGARTPISFRTKGLAQCDRKSATSPERVRQNQHHRHEHPSRKRGVLRHPTPGPRAPSGELVAINKSIDHDS